MKFWSLAELFEPVGEEEEEEDGEQSAMAEASGDATMNAENFEFTDAMYEQATSRQEP